MKFGGEQFSNVIFIILDNDLSKRVPKPNQEVQLTTEIPSWRVPKLNNNRGSEGRSIKNDNTNTLIPDNQFGASSQNFNIDVRQDLDPRTPNQHLPPRNYHYNTQEGSSRPMVPVNPQIRYPPPIMNRPVDQGNNGPPRLVQNPNGWWSAPVRPAPHPNGFRPHPGNNQMRPGLPVPNYPNPPFNQGQDRPVMVQVRPNHPSQNSKQPGQVQSGYVAVGPGYVKPGYVRVDPGYERPGYISTGPNPQSPGTLAKFYWAVNFKRNIE